MSHITIIISKAATSAEDLTQDTSYDYRIPVPHGTSPMKVGEMVRRAYRHLEGHLVDGSGQQVEE